MDEKRDTVLKHMANSPMAVVYLCMDRILSSSKDGAREADVISHRRGDKLVSLDFRETAASGGINPALG